MEVKTSMIKQFWKDISDFEEMEVKAWKKANPIQKEARASARMEAYVKLFEREIFK